MLTSCHLIIIIIIIIVIIIIIIIINVFVSHKIKPTYLLVTNFSQQEEK